MAETENFESECISFIETCLKETLMHFMCPTVVHWRILNTCVTNQKIHIFFHFTNMFRSLLLSSSGCVTT